mgnify:CR=1 FL=1
MCNSLNNWIEIIFFLQMSREDEHGPSYAGEHEQISTRSYRS